MWKLAVLLGFTHAVKFKRCLWDELIFSRYAFNDDDKKVDDSGLCGDLCDLSS